MNYRHCKLLNGNVHQTSWIPEEFAVVGKILVLKDPITKKWENGWEIVSASGMETSLYVEITLLRQHKFISW